jgi:hypothetical protein
VAALPVNASVPAGGEVASLDVEATVAAGTPPSALRCEERAERGPATLPRLAIVAIMASVGCFWPETLGREAAGGEGVTIVSLFELAKSSLSVAWIARLLGASGLATAEAGSDALVAAAFSSGAAISLFLLACASLSVSAIE